MNYDVEAIMHIIREIYDLPRQDAIEDAQEIVKRLKAEGYRLTADDDNFPDH